MGQTFQNLTKTGTYDPNSGQIGFNRETAPLDANAGATADAAIMRASGANPNAQAQPLQSVKPSFEQATKMGATPGGANALSPGLSKGGKLLTILTSGLQGALAGRAASEQAVIQSGGRRSGGAGMGFEAGYTLPWQRAQQLAQTQVAVGGAQPVEVPGVGQMPAALAGKILTPVLGAQSRIGAAQIGGQSREAAAQTAAGARTQAAQIGAGARTQAAQTEADARVKAAQMNLGPLAAVPEDLQEQLGLPPQLPLRMLNQAESAANRPLTVVAGENDSYLVNRQTREKTPLGVGNRGAGAVNAGLVPVVDDDNPGVVTYQRKGSAVGRQTPQGAATVAAKTEARSEVPTKIGDQKVAFNTALQHADLLQNALTYLNDPKNPSNLRAWNSVKNRFKTEFGSSDVTNFQVIANAYTREVTKMLSGNHMTDAEISSAGGTLPANASPAQILGAIQSYRSLAQSKLNQLNQQAGAATAPRKKASAPAGRDPLGIL